MHLGLKMKQTKLKEEATLAAQKILKSKSNVSYFDEPFRHLVIDNFLSSSLANACLENFPQIDSDIWEYENDQDIEIKYRTKWESEFDIPEGIVDVVRILNSAIFLRAISQRIGIKKIIPDPYFTGGGLNITMPGGLLDVHVDGNYHDATGLNRRLNAILYLNPDWEPSWGGEFGIYNRTGQECIKKVSPLFNRLVVFDSHDFSFHGLPEPLNFPEGIGRKSIILYYYTKEVRPPEHTNIKEPHSALWVKRQLRDKKGNLSRDHE